MNSARRWILIVVFALGLGGIAAPAWAQATPITSCGNINNPGSYKLAGNLTAAGNCLQVFSDFVTIDLDGFTILGDGTGTAIGNAAGGRGTTVRNGKIFGFANGLSFPTGIQVVVEAMTLTNIANVGVTVGAGSVVKDTRTSADPPGTGTGFFLIGSGSTVIGNTAMSHNVGFQIPPNSAVINNTSANNTSGFTINCPSNVLGNTATDSGTLIGPGCRSDHNLGM